MGTHRVADVVGFDRMARWLPRSLIIAAIGAQLVGAQLVSVGPALIPVLQSTGLAELVWAVLVGVPLLFG